MNALPRILAVGAMDGTSIRNASGLDVAWSQLGVDAPGNGSSLRRMFGTPDPTFRRLDRLTRALVLAARASGIDRLLSQQELEDTALIVETAHGSLEVDLRYARSLTRGVARPALFPYTLPSTCLGDVALRLGSKGPTLSFSIEAGDEGEALREARRMIAAGEVRTAIAGTVDALDETLGARTPVLRAVVALVASEDVPLPAVAGWPDERSDPFTALARACRPRRAAHD